jgi:outer membrane receptor protein involved in Fe transport
MNARFALAAGFSIAQCLWAVESRADDTSLEGLLAQEVVTTASKSAESSQDAPALVRSISAEDIRRYGMTSVAEALDFLGVGVHVEHALGHSDLTARGIGFANDGGNHTLVLLDGIGLNDPLLGTAPIDQRLGLPLEMIDHIEVVLGPGSAIYGTNAVLAVVNIFTKSAKTMEGSHVVAEAGALGTLRATATTGQSFDLFGKRAGLSAGLSYFRQRSSIDIDRQTLAADPVTNQPVTWGGTANHAYRMDIPALRLRLVRDGLEVTARVAMSDVGEPAGLGDFDHPDGGSVERRTRLAVSQRFSLGRFGDLTATVYGQTYASDQRVVVSRRDLCPFPGTTTCDYRVRERSDRLGAELRTELDWLQDRRVVTALGASTSIDHVSSGDLASDDGTGSALAAPMPNLDVSSVLNLAANGQQTLRPFSWLDLVGGGRVDWRNITDDDGDTHVFTPIFTPRLAVAARPWAGATTKLIYAEAFRAPNPYEVDASGPTFIRAGAMPPERTRSYEATFEQRFGAHRLLAGVFRTEYHDIINLDLLTADEARAAYLAGLTPVPPSVNAPLSQYRSDDQMVTHGFQVAADGDFLSRRLHYGATFTGALAHTNSQETDLDERVKAAPQWFGNARVAYDFGDRLPTAALATTFAGNAASDRSYSGGSKRVTFAPPSLEVRATLTGQVPWVKGLSYRVIVSHQRHDATSFAVGPTMRPVTGFEATPLTPTKRWNALVGLQYDFGN